MTWDLMPFLSKVLQVLIILNKENGSESSRVVFAEFYFDIMIETFYVLE